MSCKIGFAIVLLLVTSACGRAYNTPTPISTPTPTPFTQPTHAATATPTPTPTSTPSLVSPDVVATPALREILVDTRDSKFTPATITVNQDETVSLVVQGSAQFHTFTADGLGLNIALLPYRAVVEEITFTRSGTFEFYCLIPTHRDRGMVGTIEVLGEGSTPLSPLTLPPSGPSPALGSN